MESVVEEGLPASAFSRPPLGGTPAFPVQWRWFLRALADEIDANADAEGRNELLRGIGQRMAAMVPLPQASSLETLQMEMNDALAHMGWGTVVMRLDETDRSLRFLHVGLPRIGTAGTPPGSWLAALLEGLYETWMSQQPGADASLVATLEPNSDPGTVVLRYARG